MKAAKRELCPRSSKSRIAEDQYRHAEPVKNTLPSEDLFNWRKLQSLEPPQSRQFRPNSAEPWVGE